jgi:class 3 adenylate cyclase/tetratricopeptide (TPR) repeat protein
VAACPACRKKLPGEFPFCPFCGAPLASVAPTAALEERKVVSVLFCDLVGFTAASERADPEDVRARLRPYHARVRSEIERYGGTVEKFVGDAVMAVFGAPVTHEDDAERAVRAGLRVLEAIEDLNSAQPELELRVRIGINTGETVVDRGARPELGEGIVAGDVVNTAARLQSVAPVGGIAVGEITYLQTRRVFEYEQLESAQVKGKADWLAVWRPLEARARFGTDVTRMQDAGFVGRGAELERLRTSLERTLRDRQTRLVTLVGEPGIGKSRLLAEFRNQQDELAAPMTWRQGRCLPYGDGIAFWALGEIVKAHAGIYESDTAQTATEKLEAVLPEVEERSWLRARLQPLLGIESGQDASREESFTAWRRFLEAIAHDGATIVVEDLHWADLALLDFISELTEHGRGVPLLVICTTRPELYDHSPAWSDQDERRETIPLAPLSEEETAELVSTRVGQPISADAHRLILDRAEGNPLYAEEVVRLLAEKDLLGEPLADVPVPDSLQALIAARLDTLPVSRKSLLQDAAVIGSVFWPSALAAMGARDAEDVDLVLQELARKELIRTSEGPSIEGESEYAFWHIVIRDVAYAQIARAERARRHVAAAQWIEARAGERIGDVAELIAHHYLAALDVSRAVGIDRDTEELEEAAVRYLTQAAVWALPLDVSSAEVSFAKALELASPGNARRAMLLERWAEAAEQLGRLQEAKTALEEAVALYRELAEPVATGRALTVLSHLLQRLGNPRREDVMAEALAVLEGQPAGPELVAAYSQLAARGFVDAAYSESIAAADRALALASELDLDEPGRALGFRGGARACLGDRDGLSDMRRALELAIEQGKGRDAAVVYSNLAVEQIQYDGPAAALATCLEGVEFAERRGIAEFALGLSGQSANHLLELGRTDEALARARESSAHAETAGAVPELIETRTVQLRVLAERGRPEAAQATADELIEIARTGGESQQFAATLAVGALVYRADSEKARVLLVELERTPSVRRDQVYATHLPELVRGALAIGDRQLAGALVDGVAPGIPLYDHVLCACGAQLAEAAAKHAEAAFEYAEAAERWRAFGRVTECARALLGQGRCMVVLGDAGARLPLAEGRDLFSSMSYGPALAETEALLAQLAALPTDVVNAADRWPVSE